MRKLALAAAVLLALTSTAHADWNHHHGPRPGYGGGGGGNWAAPLIGGLVIGGMLGALSQPRYYQDVPPYHVECRPEPVYDYYGNFMGYQRRCWNVPNY